MNDPSQCINCGRQLLKQNGAWLCPVCNSDRIDTSCLFKDDPEDGEYVFIECPGATLYAQGTNEVEAGVEFIDNDDATRGYRIVGHPVYAPNHHRRRRIRREALGKIRRCRACQDYTVRMRRPEGRDFYIPSSKHPDRKQLKPMTHVTREPQPEYQKL
jgi:hypothetical protein